MGDAATDYSVSIPCSNLRTRRGISGRAFLLGVLVLAGSTLLAAIPVSALEQAKGANLKLMLNGPDGTTYEGRCFVTRADAEEELELSGKIPESLSFEGEGLKCTLRSDGRLTVEASKDDGNISRSTTSGGTVTISIR